MPCLNQIIVLQKKRLRHLLRRRKNTLPKQGSIQYPSSLSRAGGRVINYARDGPKGKRSRDLESDELEQLSLELKQHRCASFFLSCLYRPPRPYVVS